MRVNNGVCGINFEATATVPRRNSAVDRLLPAHYECLNGEIKISKNN
jgi:hypothetical protein